MGSLGDHFAMDLQDHLDEPGYLLMTGVSRHMRDDSAWK
jgi:hypothetical protein